MWRLVGLTCIAVLAGATPIDPGRIVSSAMWTNPDTRIELAPGERVTAYARERYVEQQPTVCPLCDPFPSEFRLSAVFLPDATGRSVQLDMLTYDGELYGSYSISLTGGRMIWQGGAMDVASGTTKERPMDYAALFTWGALFRFDVVNTGAGPLTLIALSASTTGYGEEWRWMNAGANPADAYVPTVENPEPATAITLIAGVLLFVIGRRSRERDRH